jgi:carbamoyltransferase
MNILGIQKNHNSSVALFNDYQLIYYNQEERLSRVKRDSFFPVKCLEQIKKLNVKIDKVIMTGYDTEGDFQLFSVLKKLGLVERHDYCYHYFKSHHITHAAKALYSSGFKEALVFVYDGRGSSYMLENGHSAYETLSVYLAKQPFSFDCKYKKLLSSAQGENKKVLYNLEPFSYDFKTTDPLSLNSKTIFEVSSYDSLCPLYTHVSGYIGFNNDNEGKTMGLKAYGGGNAIVKNIFYKKDLFHTEYDLNNKYKLEEEPKILAFEAQRIFENTFKKVLDTYKNLNKNIILTGGGALNILNNYKVQKHIKDTHQLYIDPMCGDEGNSIGAALLHLQNHNKKDFVKINDIYLGPKPELKKISKTKPDTINHLLNKKIVALFQGRAEGGPRALGNRSLLFDPRVKNGKDIVNKVKKREWFRPFGCSILEEEAHKWFDMQGLKESPYMLYGVQCLPNKKNLIPSIVHADNSCRIQTVNEKQNKVLYDILKEFYKRTKVPILLNTSFNLSNEPLVETQEEAIDVFNRSDIDVLYFPEIKEEIKK